MKIHVLVPLLFLVAGFAAGAVPGSGDSYEIQTDFGDTVSCDYVTEGIFIVWWDSKNDLSDQAYILLDTIQVYRNECLESLDMQDPPNPQDGFFFNIYLHEPGDVFPDGWSCGVGTDSYGYPYLTLPISIVLNWDWMTMCHEAFHIFQYSSDAPGFDGVDVFWFIEASANWFAAVMHPGDPDSFVEAMTLVKVPHVAMWLGYDNYPSYYPDNWQRYCHQYAMALFLYYLTEVEGMPYSLICDGFYNGISSPIQDLNPQEYLYYSEYTGDLRIHFMNWAARMTNNFDFILQEQAETAELHWSSYADPEDDNQFTQIFNDSGSSGWYSPPDSLVTTAWSFNTYKVLNTGDNAYTFTLSGDLGGSMGDAPFFLGKVVVQNAFAETRFYDLEMQTSTFGTLTVDVAPSDTALYLIVGSLPEMFSGAEQVFPYDISVEPSFSSADQQEGQPGELLVSSAGPNPFCYETVIEISVPFHGQTSLEVFDITGRSVASLVNGEVSAGFHEVPWNGRTDSGESLPSGLYVVNLRHAGNSSSYCITIMR